MADDDLHQDDPTDDDDGELAGPPPDGVAAELAGLDAAEDDDESPVFDAEAVDRLRTWYQAMPSARALPPGPRDAPYPVPSERLFRNNAGEGVAFIMAPDIRTVAERLIDECEELGFIRNHRVAYVWRRKGGTSKGNLILGRCDKTSGPVGALAGFDFVLSISRDHLAAMGVTRHQVEALTYHELRHIDETEEGLPAVVGHDAEVFYGELERYGLWRRDLERFRQLDMGL